jgi:hypothetical protein
MSDKFLELCITETFGIREGIINLVSTFAFLIKAKVRKVIDQLPDTLLINKPNMTDGHGTLEEDYGMGLKRMREEIDDPDPTKDGQGLINLYFDPVIDGNGNRQPLSIIKKRDIEWRKPQKASEGKAECVLSLVKG